MLGNKLARSHGSSISSLLQYKLALSYIPIKVYKGFLLSTPIYIVMIFFLAMLNKCEISQLQWVFNVSAQMINICGDMLTMLI